jgi:hypothetical protein
MSSLPAKRLRVLSVAAVGTATLAAVASVAVATLPAVTAATPASAADAYLSTAGHVGHAGLAVRPAAAPAAPAAGQLLVLRQAQSSEFRHEQQLAAAKAAADRVAAHKAAVKAAAAKTAAKAAAARQTATQAVQQTAVSTPSGSPEQVAEQMLGQYGWPAGQFSCLGPLWTQESGWNVSAENPSSGAYGIPQALPGSKMASAGSDWATDAATQIRWGLTYIKSLYGSPCGAWAHEEADGWY